MEYRYKISRINTAERWIFIRSNDELELEVPDSFYKLLEIISGRLGGNIVEVGDMQYKIENDECDYVYQWDGLFGITIIYPAEMSSDQAVAILRKYIEDLKEGD